MNRLALIAGGLATALALLLSGCGSSGPSLNGPFGDSAHASNGSQCGWAPAAASPRDPPAQWRWLVRTGGRRRPLALGGRSDPAARICHSRALALAETFGLLIATVAVVIVCGLFLPAGTTS